MLSEQVTYWHTDFCPYCNEDHTIKVNYLGTRWLGQDRVSYRAMSRVCDLADECPIILANPKEDCPVAKTVPAEPF